MSEKQKKIKRCNRDCFNCAFDDCILTDAISEREYQAEYRRTHVKEIKETQKRWYAKNCELVKDKKKQLRKEEREKKYSVCHICGKPIKDGAPVYIHKSRSFCSDVCYGLFLVARENRKPKVKGEL